MRTTCHDKPAPYSLCIWEPFASSMSKHRRCSLQGPVGGIAGFPSRSCSATSVPFRSEAAAKEAEEDVLEAELQEQASADEKDSADVNVCMDPASQWPVASLLKAQHLRDLEMERARGVAPWVERWSHRPRGGFPGRLRPRRKEGSSEAGSRRGGGLVRLVPKLVPPRFHMFPSPAPRSRPERRRGKQMHSRSRGALPRPAARLPCRNEVAQNCVAIPQVQQVWRRRREMAQRRMRAACKLSLSDWHSGSVCSLSPQSLRKPPEVLLLQFFVRRWRRKRQLAARKIQARWLTAQSLSSRLEKPVEHR